MNSRLTQVYTFDRFCPKYSSHLACYQASWENFIWSFLPPEVGENSCLTRSCPVYGIWLWQPKQTNTVSPKPVREQPSLTLAASGSPRVPYNAATILQSPSPPSRDILPLSLGVCLSSALLRRTTVMWD